MPCRLKPEGPTTYARQNVRIFDKTHIDMHPTMMSMKVSNDCLGPSVVPEGRSLRRHINRSCRCLALAKGHRMGRPPEFSITISLFVHTLSALHHEPIWVSIHISIWVRKGQIGRKLPIPQLLLAAVLSITCNRTGSLVYDCTASICSVRYLSIGIEIIGLAGDCECPNVYMVQQAWCLKDCVPQHLSYRQTP